MLRVSDTEPEVQTAPGTEDNREDNNQSNPQQASSIFDSFDVAPQKPKLPDAPGGMASSIFDSFDAAPATPTNKGGAGQMQSSIFDDFGAAPPKKPAPASTDTMASSIFDSFDAPARPPPPKQSSDSGQMQSSIFDDFNAPPPPKKTTTTPQSSILDSYDAAPSSAPSIFDEFDTAPPSKPKTVQNPSGSMASSIFDSFDGPQAAPQTSTPIEAAEVEKKEEEVKLDTIEPLEPPKLWEEWRQEVILYASARRLLRELACLMAELHGDAFDPPKLSFSKDKESLLPAAAAEILQLPCEGEIIIGKIRGIIEKICASHQVGKEVIVPLALRLFAVPDDHSRMFYGVLLHLATNRGDLAEDLIRDAAHLMMQKCDSFALANDPPVGRGKTISHMASLYLRRHATRLSWQLELCLWLHRGGALPLSGVATNEAIVAVRVGFAIASWNRNYECLETMIKCDPDCHMDGESGRQLWTSLKIISNADNKERATGKTSSGGWEFLVDCRRSEATDLLRHKQTGCFIIRPHVEDHGVFTLSFKTNLVPTPDAPVEPTVETSGEGNEKQEDNKPPRPPPKAARPVKKDDVVQHAIIRLSDSGFRCGSFGPFGSLMKLLEAVSASLPFDLRFDQPPAERVIKDEGSQPSPNAVFLRKLVLRHADSMIAHPPSNDSLQQEPRLENMMSNGDLSSNGAYNKAAEERFGKFRQNAFGIFLELLVLSAIRKPLSAVASSKYEDQPMLSEAGYLPTLQASHSIEETNSDDVSDTKAFCAFDEQYAGSSRMLRQFLAWCRMLELAAECEFAPGLRQMMDAARSPQITLAASETAIEAIEDVGRGDSVIRRMIQPNSGVDFRTLRLADGGDSTVVVLFSKKEAIEWLINHGSEKTKEAAMEKLAAMERIRVIEPIDLSKLQLKAYPTQKGSKPEEEHTGVRYRIVDPWEVEALESREGETKSASIGRERFLAFSLGLVASACETILRPMGGLSALELWTSGKGGVALTKAIASVHPPWERGEGGDMQFAGGLATEPSPFTNSIRQHLYRNSLFRTIRLPQRFLALVQVELLDLKNLTAPGGSLSLTVYALLRLRRSDSGAPLTSKTRTLDSAATQPMKLAKSTGPNAPASWGSVVRFRFPLPEDVSCDGVSLDRNREILFKVSGKTSTLVLEGFFRLCMFTSLMAPHLFPCFSFLCQGPPCVLQLSVYERKLLIDNPLGDADVKIDGLAAGGQLEEWVPLRTGKNGIHWFARIRLTLRFELMCLAPPADTEDKEDGEDEAAPSVGLRRIHHLSRMGGAQEDVKKSMSSPDLLSYFESMVY